MSTNTAQAIRVFLSYRGAIHKKVVQRHRGYKYLKQLLRNSLVSDKATIRFLFGTVLRTIRMALHFGRWR